MDAIIILHIGIAVWLYRYFANNDRGLKEPPAALKKAAFFGAIATIFAGIINSFTVPEVVEQHLDGSGAASVSQLVIASLLIGLVEESLKFVPLAFFIYKKKYFDELTDGVVYFALAGIWFGAIESITYTLSFGPEVGALRAIVTPFLHAGFSSLAGVGLARQKMLEKSWTTVGLWFGLAIGAHALYDFLLFSDSGVLSTLALLLGLMVNISLFFLFRRAQKVDETLGKSAVGENRFCRKCGLPNPERNLFCTRCGERT